jgi:hypothetical protein
MRDSVETGARFRPLATQTVVTCTRHPATDDSSALGIGCRLSGDRAAE